MFTLALFAVFSCGDRDSGRVLGPDSGPASRPAYAPPENASFRLADFSDAPISGRWRTDVLLNGIRVSHASAHADSAIRLFVTGLLGDGDGNGVLDLLDFFLLADTFGLVEGARNWYSLFDADGDGDVDFDDFFAFADYFGVDIKPSAGKKAAWDAIAEAANRQQSSAKRLQGLVYEIRVSSEKSPPEFKAFAFSVAGAFPKPGEGVREIELAPEGYEPTPTPDPGPTPEPDPEPEPEADPDTVAVLPVAKGAASVNPKHVPFVDRHIP
ncbi:MAG: hypothetical protein Q8P78_01170 [bacterium]|nr:hypothetical protein [bacterium]